MEILGMEEVNSSKPTWWATSLMTYWTSLRINGNIIIVTGKGVSITHKRQISARSSMKLERKQVGSNNVHKYMLHVQLQIIQSHKLLLNIDILSDCKCSI